jgi:hypothetical protein
MEQDPAKYRFYEMAAKRFKAELRLYGATAAVHIENKNDEVFWGKVLHVACPGGKFRFISGSRNPNGNMTCGCTQCLQYKPFLDRHFLIAIDSDYRYLTGESGIDADHFILQTYTYSFENHFCYAQNANRALQRACDSAEPLTAEFDFRVFLTEYSKLVYPLLVWQLYLEHINPEVFPKHVFHRLLSLPIGGRSLENNGAAILAVLRDRSHKMIRHFRRQYPDADYTWFEARCNALGVHRDNAYLYVRGHQLYDCICMQGRKFVSHRRKAEEDANGGHPLPGHKWHAFEATLTEALCFDMYPELRWVLRDARRIMGTSEDKTNEGRVTPGNSEDKTRE